MSAVPPVHKTRSHFKSRNGCIRCKARKVKCDEVSPTCRACAKHGATCVYKRPSRLAFESLQKSAPYKLNTRSKARNSDSHGLSQRMSRDSPVELDINNSRNVLELQLLHQFIVHTCKTFAPHAEQGWAKIAPLIAFRHEFLLDAMLATAALHLEKTTVSEFDLSSISRSLLQKTLDGHQNAIKDISSENCDATVLSAGLVTFHTFVQMSELTDDDAQDVDAALLRWLSVGQGSALVYQHCQDHFAEYNHDLLRLMNPNPRFNRKEMYMPENREGLEHLLERATEHEVLTNSDREAYEKALSVVGSIYRAIHLYHEPAISVHRRIFVLPSCVPPRFCELVRARRPRALAIMAYVLGSVKLIKSEPWWLKGVAERQLPIIQNLLPSGWKSAIEVPLNRLKTN